ncbi:uncharacterized protein [Rutidosis leptorrhynchoides]|uniref:uncharacterized protein isoform X1 n=1 Tax=Rutidosis leptorrhynchoides TaxID=125765 RepID=UPI003A99242C
MFDLNARIRVFQQSLDSATFEAFGSDKVSQDEDTEMGNAREVEEAIRDLEAKLAQIISETNKMELEFQSEQNFHMQEQKVLDDLKHRISLMESVMEGSKELQELAIYPHFNFLLYLMFRAILFVLPLGGSGILYMLDHFRLFDPFPIYLTSVG